MADYITIAKGRLNIAREDFSNDNSTTGDRSVRLSIAASLISIAESLEKLALASSNQVRMR